MRGRAYSVDLRERAMADADAGLSAEAVAQKYRVSPWWVYKLKRQRRASGSLAPRPQGGHKPQVLAGQEVRLRELVQAQPDATLKQLRERLGVSVSLSVLWAALDRLGLTYKKNPARRRAATPRR